MSEAGISSAPPAKRALVFRLPGKESADNAHILMRALEKVGIPGELCPYWPDGEASWETETVLLEREIGSAPRLTAVEFQQRFGFELDLVELSLHQFATEPLTPELLLPESTWRQHLRGVAVLAAERMKASGADVVFVAHGAETVSRIIAEMAAHLGLRFLYWESGFFPGYVYVDPWAPHFFRGECWIDSQPLPDEPSPEAIAFLATWRKARLSKYAQTNKGLPPEVAAWATQDDRPILFLPGQVPTDANVVVNLGRHKTLSALYKDTINNLPNEWRVLYKPHPRCAASKNDDLHLGTNRFISSNIDIHDAFDICSAVLTLSSNVGLESILFGRRTFALGRPAYTIGNIVPIVLHKNAKTYLSPSNTTVPTKDSVLLLTLMLKVNINEETSHKLTGLIELYRPYLARKSRSTHYKSTKTIQYREKLARLALFFANISSYFCVSKKVSLGK